MKRVLVLCSGYPSEKNPYNCTWAHIRNKYYVKYGLQVDVMHMDNVLGYHYDDIDIVGHRKIQNNLKNDKYFLIISHSPNIRKHLPFLKNIPDTPIILFMHGSESMYINKDYPEPYPYMRENLFKRIIRQFYDEIKFISLRRFILARKYNIVLVFVSNWMKEIFKQNVFDPDQLLIEYHIINNSIGDWSLLGNYKYNFQNKMADFVTLRRLDYSKFAIDLVVKSAVANPSYQYHIYGKGKYFRYNFKPDNITVFNKHIHHNEIPFVLNNYRCALMPTRCDAQGVMVCEMASYGMPVITTDIDVNIEMLSSYRNVKMVGEGNFTDPINLDEFCCYTKNTGNKERFSLSHTIDQELQCILFFKRKLI